MASTRLSCNFDNYLISKIGMRHIENRYGKILKVVTYRYQVHICAKVFNRPATTHVKR